MPDPADSGSGAAPGTAPEAALPDVETYLAGMTLEEKVGQLFFVRPEALDPGRSAADGESAPGVRRMTEEMRDNLARCPVGGVVIFGKNISSPGQLTEFLAALQSA